MVRILLILLYLLSSFGWDTALAATNTTIQIVAPSNGATFHPGDEVSLTIAVSNPAGIVGVMAFGEFMGASEGMATPPFVTSLRIPESIETGEKKIKAYAKLTDGREISHVITIKVVPEGVSLGSLDVFPPSIRFRYIGDQTSLRIDGKYADGRTVSFGSGNDLTIISSDPNVVIVDTSGNVTAVGAGEANVVVRFGSVTATVPLVVVATVRGDFTMNQFVDMQDMNVLQAALNTVARKPVDARDLNGDGKIDALDLRILTTLCSKPRCASE